MAFSFASFSAHSDKPPRQLQPQVIYGLFLRPREPSLVARAVPAFYRYFIDCGMQFAEAANESNMRIAVLPEENEKSEPFSNRKQVRIFLVWWARVDYASRAAKNSPLGCFCAVFCDSAAAVRIHP